MSQQKRSDRELILRVFTFFQDASNGAGLQMRRLYEDDPEDEVFIARRWYDWQTLITSLWRMRQTAKLMARANVARSPVDKAIAMFDRTLPMLKDYRDVFEHMDSYILKDEGRHNKRIKVGGLQVGMVDREVFSWMIDGKTITLKEAATASSQLYADIKKIRDGFE